MTDESKYARMPTNERSNQSSREVRQLALQRITSMEVTRGLLAIGQRRVRTEIELVLEMGSTMETTTETLEDSAVKD